MVDECLIFSIIHPQGSTVESGVGTGRHNPSSSLNIVFL